MWSSAAGNDRETYIVLTLLPVKLQILDKYFNKKLLKDSRQQTKLAEIGDMTLK